jgi:hypothetical protein
VIHYLYPAARREVIAFSGRRSCHRSGTTLLVPEPRAPRVSGSAPAPTSPLFAWIRCSIAAALVAVVVLGCGAAPRAALERKPDAIMVAWPEGTEALPFDNVEGVMLVRATVSSRPGRGSSPASSEAGARSGTEPSTDPEPAMRVNGDTTGWFALDTGAGFLAMDSQLAVALGIADSLPRRSIDVAPRPLARLTLGGLAMDQVSPVLVLRSHLLDRVAERDVMGLIGHRVMQDRALWVDYEAGRLALVPAGPLVEMEETNAIAESRRLLQAGLSPAAIPCRFRMTEDGKVLLRARVTPHRGGGPTPWLTWVLDTGASKATLFEDVVEPLARTSAWRPVMRGLIAPTLLATSSASLCRMRRIEVRGSAGTAEGADIELALIRNPLARELAGLAGEPVHGLLGYSFLQQFRLACDYPRRVLWLDPIPRYRDEHPLRHTHVGLQIELERGRVKIVAVVESSPAARAGIAAGDELLAVDGVPVSGLGSGEVTRRLQGREGSTVTLTLRRGELERTHRLRRQRLL